MKAAIIGYGKMGREIERILHERGHEAALVIDTENAAELDAEHLRGIDVALEFTTPATAYRNIRTCIECGVAVVSGTTGWTCLLYTSESRRRDGHFVAGRKRPRRERDVPDERFGPPETLRAGRRKQHAEQHA